ncbi:hypothetical protein B296_00034148 [Ensete ventricosum]|uniref:Uncharacterized protein n=1 Tax=Ensete ventricosum TaxID=4639 RepID=A0A426WXL8_ENSVE|nr:hypothetical protein B296_00034148 [Ensete ventricosum]
MHKPHLDSSPSSSSKKETHRWTMVSPHTNVATSSAFFLAPELCGWQPHQRSAMQLESASAMQSSITAPPLSLPPPTTAAIPLASYHLICHMQSCDRSLPPLPLSLLPLLPFIAATTLPTPTYSTIALGCA